MTVTHSKPGSACCCASATTALKDHDLVAGLDPASLHDVHIEKRPVHDSSGRVVEGLHATWIVLDNEKQLNSYTTEMVKSVILAFRAASNDRAAVAVVFTGAGTRAFCSGGNTEEYADYYAGRPEEYRQYMRLFNDMVSAILACDKPVICRANGLRVAGGQEIGMACDYTLASDLAVFGQAGPRHGSAPDGGATDFLPLFTGVEHAMASCTLCETWSAHKAHRLGLVHEIVPVLRVEGGFIANPLVHTQRWLDEYGRLVHGEPKAGTERVEGEKLLKSGTIDLSLLDEAVDRLITKLLHTMPGCTTKTVESVRKHKLAHWDKNRESNRAWLGLNMVTEAKAGFRAFQDGAKGDREVDFAELRRAIARGERWTGDLARRIQPASARAKACAPADAPNGTPR
ncbi:MAG TPA: 6-oxocyclohex-1-ene-1-carbonyl-CoA hydratase [Planctomycetota bacterium]|jgi:6-oxo-cyclohex-1-ene-carbonyl-CoA hydrolase|nr:6-oxocyclohex-1-ene-1-carbonyl-CoA hydratase [Planctomycetota bacterium]